MADDLETVLTRLQDAEINVWIATEPPAHIGARIRDPRGGPAIAREFHADADGSWPRGAMAAWLREQAERLYPDRFAPAKPPHPGLM